MGFLLGREDSRAVSRFPGQENARLIAEAPPGQPCHSPSENRKFSDVRAEDWGPGKVGKAQSPLP